MSMDPSALECWIVLAVIQPFKLDDVTLALEAHPHFGGMTVIDCRGFGRGKAGGEQEPAERESRARREHLVDFTEKTRIEIAVAGRAAADSIADTIVHAAHTGNPGDGKVFVWPLARAIQVRTFDEAERAV